MGRLGHVGLFVLVLMLVGCGESASTSEEVAGREPAKIRFELASCADPSARIIGLLGSEKYLVDSLPIVEGVVEVRRDTALPSGLYFLALPSGLSYQFLLDEDQSLTIQSDVRAPLTSAKVEGSFDNELLYQYLRWEQGYLARLNPVMGTMNALPPNDPGREVYARQLEQLTAERRAHIGTYQAKHPEVFFTRYVVAGEFPAMEDVRQPDGQPDVAAMQYRYRNSYWQQTPLNDSRLLRTPVIAAKLEAFFGSAVPAVHDSVVKYVDQVVALTKDNREMFQYVVNWLAEFYHVPKAMGLESVFVHLVDEYFTPEKAYWASKEDLAAIKKDADEMRPSLVGMVGQDLACINLQGKEERLHGLPGRVKILFMWNYECEHCREEAPLLRDLERKYGARGLSVYALCMGNDEQEWKKFVEEAGLERFHNVWDPNYHSRYYAKYHVDVTPELYVLDGQHRIVCKDVMPGQLEPVLEGLLE